MQLMVAVRGGYVAGHCRHRAYRAQASYASHRSHAAVRSQRSCGRWWRAILDRTRRLARAGHRSPRCCFRQNARRPAKCLNIHFNDRFFFKETRKKEEKIDNLKIKKRYPSLVLESVLRERESKTYLFLFFLYLHFGGDKIRDVATILLLRVPH